MANILTDKTVFKSSAGAIPTDARVVVLNGGTAQAMTLADGDKIEHQGHELYIVAGSANAHTVTYTGGFAGVGTGGDVATFGGAVGDYLHVVCINGIWYDLDKQNVTLA